MYTFELPGSHLRKIKSLLVPVNMKQCKLYTSRPVTIVATNMSNIVKLRIELDEDIFYSLPPSDDEILIPHEVFKLEEVLHSDRMELKICSEQQKAKMIGRGKYTKNYHNRFIPVQFKSKNPVAKAIHPQKNLHHLLSVGRVTESATTITFDGADSTVTWYIGKDEPVNESHILKGKMHFPDTTFIKSPSGVTSNQYATRLLYLIFQNSPQCQNIDISLYKTGEIQLEYSFLDGSGSVKYRVRSQ